MSDQSPNGLSTSADPRKGFLGGGISKKILMIVVAGIFSLLMFIVYIISQKGQHNSVDKKEGAEQVEQTQYSGNAQEGMNEILSQAPDSNRITPPPPPIPQPQAPVKQVPIVDEPSPLLAKSVKPQTQESEEDRKQRLALEREQERIRQRKEQQLLAALTAQSAINLDMEDESSKDGSKGSDAIAAAEQQVQAAMNAQQATMVQGGLEQDDPNKQGSKIAFSKEKHSNTYLLQGREKPLSQYELKIGTVIPATLISGINSDLPGQVIASVSQNVYDSATGSHLLLPQGAKLYGVYDSNVAYGQDRLLMAWTRVNYPDGTTLELEGMGGIDAQGYAGFEDQVDHHYFKIFGNAFILGMITGISEAGINDGDNGDTSTSESINNGVTEQFAETGSTLIEKNLDVQPTIKIRNGYKFNVMLNKDVILKPYSPIQ